MTKKENRAPPIAAGALKKQKFTRKLGLEPIMVRTIVPAGPSPEGVLRAVLYEQDAPALKHLAEQLKEEVNELLDGFSDAALIMGNTSQRSK